MNNITKIIFTEGPADEIFIKKLTKNDLVKIINLGGKDGFTPKKIIAESSQYINDASLDRVDLLIIRDADDIFFNTKKSIENLIAKLENKYLRNKEFYILPNNKDSGQLEHLLCEAIKLYDAKNMECIEKMIECLRGKKVTTNNRLSELQLNAYLALKIHDVGTKKFLEGELFETLIPHLIQDESWCKKLNNKITDFLEK